MQTFDIKSHWRVDQIYWDTYVSLLTLWLGSKQTRGRLEGWCCWRWGHNIWFFTIFWDIWAQVASQGRSCNLINVVTERWIQRHDGCPGPVGTGLDSLQNRPPKQDIYPWIKDLVPGCEAYPEEQIFHLKTSSGQSCPSNEDLKL